MRMRRLIVAVAAVVVASACALTAISLSDNSPQPAAYKWSRATYAPKPGSVRIEARADDPGGDAPWVVRVWITRDNLQACEQLGREVNGVVGDTGLDGRFRPLEFGERTLCSPRVLDQDEPLVQVATFLDDPLSENPKPLRTVAWGIAGPRASSVSIDGPGGRREAARTPWRAWLDVRGGDTPTYEFVTRIKYANGSVKTVDYGHARRPSRHPLPGTVAVDARIKSPQGGPERGLLTWRTANGSSCFTVGRVLGNDRVGSWSTDGTFFDYPIGEGAACNLPGTIDRDHPFAYGVSWAFDERESTVSGIADPDVEKVILTGVGARQELEPGDHGGVLAYTPAQEGRLNVTVVFKDGTQQALPALRMTTPRTRGPRLPHISAVVPKVVPVTARGSFTLRVSCSERPRRPKCMNSLFLYSAKTYKRRSGLSYRLAVAQHSIFLERGTKDRPLRMRLRAPALRLLKRDRALTVIATDTYGGKRGRREFRLRLVLQGHTDRAASASRSPAVIVRPESPGVEDRVVVAWRVPEPMDNNGDAYYIRFMGPGGDDCSSQTKYGGGVSWNVRYNHRYEHRRAKVMFGPTRGGDPSVPPPPTSQPWCRGHYSGSVVFHDLPAGLRHGKHHTSRSCTRAQVQSGRCKPKDRIVGRFEFDVR